MGTRGTLSENGGAFQGDIDHLPELFMAGARHVLSTRPAVTQRWPSQPVSIFALQVSCRSAAGQWAPADGPQLWMTRRPAGRAMFLRSDGTVPRMRQLWAVEPSQSPPSAGPGSPLRPSDLVGVLDHHSIVRGGREGAVKDSEASCGAV